MGRILEAIAAMLRELVASCEELPWILLDLLVASAERPAGGDPSQCRVLDS